MTARPPTRSPYDLVVQMEYLFVRVVKAMGLPSKDATGSCDPFAEVRLGSYMAPTKLIMNNRFPEWNQAYAFSKDMIQATNLEVSVKDKDMNPRDYIGRVSFDIRDMPKQVIRDSTPLAPEWHRLEDMNGNKLQCELMLAVWWGTQADKAFPDAWHSDAAAVIGRSNVYTSPKLWYLRVNVIEARDLIPNDKARFPEVLVKVALGHQVLRTKISMNKSTSPTWNEDLMFVVAEPFDEHLILSVEDRVAPNKDEVLGTCAIPLQCVEQRSGLKAINTRWFDLENHVIIDGVKTQVKLASKLHMRICLEGGYHVLHEPNDYISDYRPTAKELWKRSIGFLEVGILNAELSPMKTRNGRETTDAYCVAKYGTRWVKTRTILDSLKPKWNEQFLWDVFDQCTVITIGVFDNCLQQGAGDSRIGKVRIRLSTLETNRAHTQSYPLIVLHPSGVKEMGVIQLAVRFTCTSFPNMMLTYSQPLLPKMHYIHPLTLAQLDSMKYHATQILAMRLSRAEPPLRKEVVEFMLDKGSHMWSTRRGKANFNRIMGALGGLIAIGKWCYQLYNRKNTVITMLNYLFLFMLFMVPEMILSIIFIHLLLYGASVYILRRKKNPPHIDTHISFADNALPDELDEEFDTFPTSLPPDIVRMRYDRLRSISAKVQKVMGDLATQCERLESLLSWRDPRATCLFMIFCLIAAFLLYVTPFKILVQLIGLIALFRTSSWYPYLMASHPLNFFSSPLNFFSRLPIRTDSML